MGVEMEKFVVKWHLIVTYILIAAVIVYGMLLLKANVSAKRDAKEKAKSTTSSTTAEVIPDEEKSETGTSTTNWYYWMEPENE